MATVPDSISAIFAKQGMTAEPGPVSPRPSPQAVAEKEPFNVFAKQGMPTGPTETERTWMETLFAGGPPENELDRQVKMVIDTEDTFKSKSLRNSGLAGLKIRNELDRWEAVTEGRTPVYAYAAEQLGLDPSDQVPEDVFKQLPRYEQIDLHPGRVVDDPTATPDERATAAFREAQRKIRHGIFGKSTTGKYILDKVPLVGDVLAGWDYMKERGVLHRIADKTATPEDYRDYAHGIAMAEFYGGQGIFQKIGHIMADMPGLMLPMGASLKWARTGTRFAARSMRGGGALGVAGRRFAAPAVGTAKGLLHPVWYPSYYENISARMVPNNFIQPGEEGEFKVVINSLENSWYDYFSNIALGVSDVAVMAAIEQQLGAGAVRALRGLSNREMTKILGMATVTKWLAGNPGAGVHGLKAKLRSVSFNGLAGEVFEEIAEPGVRGALGLERDPATGNRSYGMLEYETPELAVELVQIVGAIAPVALLGAFLNSPTKDNAQKLKDAKVFAETTKIDTQAQRNDLANELIQQQKGRMTADQVQGSDEEVRETAKKLGLARAAEDPDMKKVRQSVADYINMQSEITGESQATVAPVDEALTTRVREILAADTKGEDANKVLKKFLKRRKIGTGVPIEMVRATAAREVAKDDAKAQAAAAPVTRQSEMARVTKEIARIEGLSTEGTEQEIGERVGAHLAEKEKEEPGYMERILGKVPERPVAAPPAAAVPPTAAAGPVIPLGSQKVPFLEKGKPRYRGSQLKFDDDITRALYIVAKSSTRRSKRHDDYLSWLVGLGIKDPESLGDKIRQQIKGKYTGQDVIDVERPAEVPAKAPVAPPAPPPEKPPVAVPDETEVLRKAMEGELSEEESKKVLKLYLGTELDISLDKLQEMARAKMEAEPPTAAPEAVPPAIEISTEELKAMRKEGALQPGEIPPEDIEQWMREDLAEQLSQAEINEYTKDIERFIPGAKVRPSDSRTQILIEFDNGHRIAVTPRDYSGKEEHITAEYIRERYGFDVTEEEAKAAKENGRITFLDKDGSSTNGLAIILVRKGASREERIETLAHELVHAASILGFWSPNEKLKLIRKHSSEDRDPARQEEDIAIALTKEKPTEFGTFKEILRHFDKFIAAFKLKTVSADTAASMLATPEFWKRDIGIKPPAPLEPEPATNVLAEETEPWGVIKPTYLPPTKEPPLDPENIPYATEVVGPGYQGYVTKKLKPSRRGSPRYQIVVRGTGKTQVVRGRNLRRPEHPPSPEQIKVERKLAEYLKSAEDRADLVTVSEPDDLYEIDANEQEGTHLPFTKDEIIGLKAKIPNIVKGAQVIVSTDSTGIDIVIGRDHHITLRKTRIVPKDYDVVRAFYGDHFTDEKIDRMAANASLTFTAKDGSSADGLAVVLIRDGLKLEEITQELSEEAIHFASVYLFTQAEFNKLAKKHSKPHRNRARQEEDIAKALRTRKDPGLLRRLISLLDRIISATGLKTISADTAESLLDDPSFWQRIIVPGQHKIDAMDLDMALSPRFSLIHPSDNYPAFQMRSEGARKREAYEREVRHKASPHVTKGELEMEQNAHAKIARNGREAEEQRMIYGGLNGEFALTDEENIEARILGEAAWDRFEKTGKLEDFNTFRGIVRYQEDFGSTMGRAMWTRREKPETPYKKRLKSLTESLVSDRQKSAKVIHEAGKAVADTREALKEAIATGQPKEVTDVLRGKHEKAQQIRDAEVIKRDEAFDNVLKDLEKAGVDIRTLSEAAKDPQTTIMIRKIIETKKANWADKFHEYWLNSILSGIQTIKTDITSSALTNLGRIFVIRPVEVLINQAPWMRKPDAAQLGELSVMAKHFIDYIPKAFQNAARARAQETAEWNLSVGISESNRFATRFSIEGKFGKFVRGFGFRNLLFIDEFVKTLSHGVESSARAYRKGKERGYDKTEMDLFIQDQVSNPYSESSKEAIPFALRSAMQLAETDMGEKFIGAWRGFEKVPYVRHWVNKFMPFIGFPFRAFERALVSAPGPNPFALMRAVQLWKDARAGVKDAEPRQLEHAARVILNNVLFFTLAYYMDPFDDDPWILGNPTTRQERADRERRNLPTYPAIWLPGINHWVNYSYVQPAGTVLGYMVDQIGEWKKGNYGSMFTKPYYGMLHGQPYLRIVTDIANLTKDISDGTFGRFGWGYLSNFTQSLIPNVYQTGMGIVTESADVRPDGAIYQNDMFGDWDNLAEAMTQGKHFVKRTAQRGKLWPIAQALFPYVEPETPKRNYYGKPIASNSTNSGDTCWLTDFFVKLVKPLPTYDVHKPFIGDQMMIGWEQKQEDPKFTSPMVATRRYTYNGKHYWMDDRQYDEFNKMRGSLVEDGILDLERRAAERGKPWDTDDPKKHEYMGIRNVMVNANNLTRSRLFSKWHNEG